jgi:serine/threonine-protein kinase
MSTISLAEGAVFADRYRIVQCIASGGMGAVYEVVHLETERRRALKVMHPHLLQSQELRDRFRQEARVAAQIESEFIVDVFDAGIDAATEMPFLVMELLRGEEIGKILKRYGRFSPNEVVTYLYQTALALDKTHRAMIVHRDLKPENLFLTRRETGAPQIKVLDFGIAKVMAESGTNANATRSLGTPLYMAPEQFQQGQKLSPATDLYALGMMAYTLLVGKAYWIEEARSIENVFAFVAAIMNGPQERATERARRAGVALPPIFDEWFATATALRPDHRFASAAALVAGLSEAMGVPAPGGELYGSPSSGVMSAGGLNAPVQGVVALGSGAPGARSLPSQTEILSVDGGMPPSLATPQAPAITSSPGTPASLGALPNLGMGGATTAPGLGMSRTAAVSRGRRTYLPLAVGSALSVAGLVTGASVLVLSRAPAATAAPISATAAPISATAALTMQAAAAPAREAAPTDAPQKGALDEPKAAPDTPATKTAGIVTPTPDPPTKPSAKKTAPPIPTSASTVTTAASKSTKPPSNMHMRD